MAEEIKEEQVEREKRVLGVLCAGVQVVGWAVIVMGVVWFAMFASGYEDEAIARRGTIESLVSAISCFSFDFMFVGLAAVIFGQLARYVFDKGYKQPVMLRISNKMLYLFAVLTIFWAVFRYLVYVQTFESVSAQKLFTQPLILPTIGKVLILVGLGLILKRIIPIIDEYKSLV